MGIVRRNRAFLITAALILVVGAALFGGVVAVRVFAAAGTATPAGLPAPASYNTVSSYGMTGYAPLKLTPTAETPSFITSRLGEGRPLVLLVYCEGAADDMEMLSYFNAVKGQFGADSSFMSFEALKTTELGDTLQQLRVSNPPILAVILGSGQVAQLYTGWIGRKVMEQVVADAVRGISVIPGALFLVDAAVDDPSPAQYTSVTASCKAVDETGAPIPGVVMTFTWYYKTTTSVQTETSGTDGIATCTRDIGPATVGYRVDIRISAEGQDAPATTSFTPRGPGAG